MRVAEVRGIGSLTLLGDLARSILGPTAQASLLDVCARQAHLPRLLGFRESVMVDCGHGFPIPDWDGVTYLRRDVRDPSLECYARHYDVAMCIDGLEHLEKEAGVALVRRLECIANAVLLFFPHEDDLDLDHHRSLWSPDCLPHYAVLRFPQWHGPMNAACLAWRIRGRDPASELDRVITLNPTLAFEAWIGAAVADGVS